MVGQAGVGEGVLGPFLNGERRLVYRPQLQNLLARAPRRAWVRKGEFFGAVLESTNFVNC